MNTPVQKAFDSPYAYYPADPAADRKRTFLALAIGSVIGVACIPLIVKGDQVDPGSLYARIFQ